jgi:hypothetical protein
VGLASFLGDPEVPSKELLQALYMPDAFEPERPMDKMLIDTFMRLLAAVHSRMTHGFEPRYGLVGDRMGARLPKGEAEAGFSDGGLKR